MLCLLLTFGAALVPYFNHVHAHVGHSDHPGVFHGNHSHDVTHHGAGDDDQIIYIGVGSFQRTVHNFDPMMWLLPAIVFIALVLYLPAAKREQPRPRRDAARVPSQFPPWPPPLRGPPSAISKGIAQR